MKLQSNDHSLNQHDQLHYPASSNGSIGSFWKEKKRIREEEEAWWNSKTQAERDEIIARTKQRELDNYLYNQ